MSNVIKHLIRVIGIDFSDNVVTCMINLVSVE